MTAPTAARPTLLFIPDISGFTDFVSRTEIDHSRHIVEELLEAIIDADEIGLTVSEIEGDAVLFYREGPAPTAAALLAQVQRMYVRFHALLRRYETHRICRCGACNSASGLALKVIAHYGAVSQNRVKEHSKLFGRDVIVAHRLMKNEVPSDEYVLVTHDLVNACASWVEVEQVAWAPPADGEEVYDAGPVAYCHIPLGPLQAHVPEPTLEDHALAGETRRVLTHERVVEARLETVFSVIADLDARPLWVDGLKEAADINHAIYQPGASHRCVFGGPGGDPHLVAHDVEVEGDLVTFTETDARFGFSTVWVLRRLGPAATRVEKHLLIRKGLLPTLMYRLFLKKAYDGPTAASLETLGDYCRGLEEEGRRHPAEVVLYAEEPAAA